MTEPYLPDRRSALAIGLAFFGVPSVAKSAVGTEPPAEAVADAVVPLHHEGALPPAFLYFYAHHQILAGRTVFRGLRAALVSCASTCGEEYRAQTVRHFRRLEVLVDGPMSDAIHEPLEECAGTGARLRLDEANIALGMPAIDHMGEVFSGLLVYEEATLAPVFWDSRFGGHALTDAPVLLFGTELCRIEVS